MNSGGLNTRLNASIVQFGWNMHDDSSPGSGGGPDSITHRCRYATRGGWRSLKDTQVRLDHQLEHAYVAEKVFEKVIPYLEPV
jgi:hypothetical protein